MSKTDKTDKDEGSQERDIRGSQKWIQEYVNELEKD